MSFEQISIIGLGYVGLPLAVETGKQYRTVGYDISASRISDLKSGNDKTQEVSTEEISEASKLQFSNDTSDLAGTDLFIVTVPTPIDEFKNPDLQPLREASKLVGNYLKRGATVVYESTVFPGCTEEVCVPILEAESGLKYNQDFFCGYSPERINPGDKDRRLSNIVKVVSGSTPEIGRRLNEYYGSIISAGTHLTSSIKVAEASKVIENAQRDINIAFVNELALIFDKMDIDTKEVLEAAGTKWNFLRFTPGLVGGHCIGVDPYYLAHKAEEVGYLPQVIMSGRRINDNMGQYIAQTVIKEASRNKINLVNAQFLVLGITFKENCPDIRNSKVIDIINELQDFGIQVDVYDPQANRQEVFEEYSIELLESIGSTYDGIVLAVSHREFNELNLEKLRNKVSVVYDVKGVLPKHDVTKRL